MEQKKRDNGSDIDNTKQSFSGEFLILAPTWPLSLSQVLDLFDLHIKFDHMTREFYPVYDIEYLSHIVSVLNLTKNQNSSVCEI